MKKSILSIALVSLLVLGSVASAITTTALSGSAPNSIAVTSDIQKIATAPYGSQWVIIPASDVYINVLSSATPDATYPVITSVNTYDWTVGRPGHIVMKNKTAGASTVSFVPKAAYVSAR